MNNLYLDHKADTCMIAEIMTQILNGNGDKHKKLIKQRIFCEKKCRITSCGESTEHCNDER